MSLENKETIIMGDYLNNNANDKSFKELMMLNGFTQSVKSSTCITDKNEALIDVILSTKAEIPTDIKVPPSPLSDN